MNKSQKPNTNPSSNSFDEIAKKINELKANSKNSKDYGQITINALKRATTKEFYRAEDLAELLEVNIMTIYRYIKAGRLKAYKIGRDFRIDKNEFNRFLKSVSNK